MATKRIPRLTDSRLVKAFFGERAKPYHYSVSHDDFDEYDNEAPGEYWGVEVPDDLAEKWNKGLAACRTAGVHPRSEEGLELRYEAMHGTQKIPAMLAEVAHEREIRLQAESHAKDARERVLVERAGWEQGIRLVLSHTSTTVNQRLAPRLAEIGVTDPVFPAVGALPKLGDTGSDYQHKFSYYRLPNGDVLRACPGIGVELYTQDRALARAYVDITEQCHGDDESDYFRRHASEVRRYLVDD